MSVDASSPDMGFDPEFPVALDDWLRVSTWRAHHWLDTMPTRDEAIVAAHRQSHLSLSAIARALGLSVSRVSRIVAGVSRQARAPYTDAISQQELS